MKFPPWDPPELTDEQLIPLMHADTRPHYESRRAQFQQIRDSLAGEVKAIRRSTANKVETSYDTYTVHKQIGEGGNGYVYKVTNSGGQEFALKLLNPRSNTEKRKRFSNELGFCERNRHPNIITVLDRGVIEDAPFYIMPCYSGSLRDLMKSSIKPERVLPIFSQILNGVEAAHLQKVIHRDLKPENILFDKKSETLIIADFGIAHFEEEDLLTAVETQDGFKLANFQYAAPEQCMRGQAVDHRADIYALGMILNEMYTGTLARGTKHKRIATVAPEYSYLDELVDEMMCSNPADRPAKIEVVKRQLRARAQAYFEEQKLSELKKTVVPISDIDDPFVVDPPKLIEYEWTPNVLTLILNQPVISNWVTAFKQIGFLTPSLSPDSFRFAGDRATIPASESEIQRIIDYFKQWVTEANKKYEHLLREEIALQQENERRKLQAEIEENEARARVRKKVKL